MAKQKSRFKNCQYFEDWSIIDKIKILIRRMYMGKKPFLVVIDTTEATMRQTVGLGILNVHIILAEDSLTAKQTFLRVFSPFVRNQIHNSIYVYDINEMVESLSNMSSDKLPLFSFIPLAGGRPPKQSDTPIMSMGNKTLEPNINTVKQTQPQSSPAQIVSRVANNPRSREFQNIDEGLPPTKNNISEEKAELIKSLGVTPTPNGYDEGTNLRVNSAVGKNVSLRNIPEDRITSNTLTKDQQEILKRFSDSNTGPSIETNMNETQEQVLIDDSLATVEGGVLSDEEIAKLKEEVKGA